MAKVVPFTAKRTNRKPMTDAKALATFNIEAEVNKDTQKLMAKLGLTEEEAVKLATDFYRSYPMLMESIINKPQVLGGR